MPRGWGSYRGGAVWRRAGVPCWFYVKVENGDDIYFRGADGIGCVYCVTYRSISCDTYYKYAYYYIDLNVLSEIKMYIDH